MRGLVRIAAAKLGRFLFGSGPLKAVDLGNRPCLRDRGFRDPERGAEYKQHNYNGGDCGSVARKNHRGSRPLIDKFSAFVRPGAVSFRAANAKCVKKTDSPSMDRKRMSFLGQIVSSGCWMMYLQRMHTNRERQKFRSETSNSAHRRARRDCGWSRRLATPEFRGLPRRSCG